MSGAMTYKRAAGNEAFGDYCVGVRVEVAVGRDLTEEERARCSRAAAELVDMLWRGSQQADPAAVAAVARTKAELLALFPPGWGHKEVPNGYDGRSPCPWLTVFTPRGPITLGWRKRVIEIRWAGTCIKGTAEDLFPGEDVTKDGQLIHAWGYDKAREYIAHLLRPGAGEGDLAVHNDVTPAQLALAPGDPVTQVDDLGTRHARVVRRAPWRLGDGTWVVGLEGVSGGYALCRVTPRSGVPRGD